MRLPESYHQNLDHLAVQLEQVQNGLKLTAEQQLTVPKAAKVNNNKSRFLVRSGNKLSVIMLDQIAGFFKDDLVLLITVAGKKYAIDHSLELWREV